MKERNRDPMREIMIEAELIAAFGMERSKELLQEIYDRLDELAEETDNSFQKNLQSNFYSYLAAKEVLERHGLLNDRMKGLLMELAQTSHFNKK